MPSLSHAIGYAFSGLATTATQTALVSRNIALAGDPDYSRRTANVISLPGGVSAVASYNRSADKRLLDKLLDAVSNNAAQQAVLGSLNRLSETIGDPESDQSLSAMIGALEKGLQAYEADPASGVLAADAYRSAETLARGLNAATAAVQGVRQQADEDMRASVERINSLLDQFKVANDAIVRGEGTPGELADNLDQRDRILKQLSEEIGIRTTTRPNNDIAIYTEGGATLFETNARKVSMEATPVYTAGTVGKAVTIDGVKVSEPSGPMAGKSGRLMALAEIRDRTAVTYQTQLDETARGLIEAFAEHDVGDPPTLPTVPGLFTHDGAPDIPATGPSSIGLAGRIAANAMADPERGGHPELIRDGGFGGPSYVRNTAGEAGYQQQLSEHIAALNAPRGFDSAAQLGTQASLKAYSADSAGWIEGRRQRADQGAESSSALQSRATDSLLRVTGVNIDEEMAVLLELERSYQASAKVMGAVDGMLTQLLEAIG